MSHLVRDRFLDELEDGGRTTLEINLNVRALAKTQNLVHSGVHLVGESFVSKGDGGHIQTGTRMHDAQRVDRLDRKWDMWKASCICAKDFDVLGAGLREAETGNTRLAIARKCIDVIIKTFTSFRWRKDAGCNCRSVLTLNRQCAFSSIERKRQVALTHGTNNLSGGRPHPN